MAALRDNNGETKFVLNVQMGTGFISHHVFLRVYVVLPGCPARANGVSGRGSVASVTPKLGD